MNMRLLLPVMVSAAFFASPASAQGGGTTKITSPDGAISAEMPCENPENGLNDADPSFTWTCEGGDYKFYLLLTQEGKEMGYSDPFISEFDGLLANAKRLSPSTPVEEGREGGSHDRRYFTVSDDDSSAKQKRFRLLKAIEFDRFRVLYAFAFVGEADGLSPELRAKAQKFINSLEVLD